MACLKNFKLSAKNYHFIFCNNFENVYTYKNGSFPKLLDFFFNDMDLLQQKIKTLSHLHCFRSCFLKGDIFLFSLHGFLVFISGEIYPLQYILTLIENLSIVIQLESLAGEQI